MFPPDARILVADDMNSVREVIIEMFNAIGFNDIVQCKDGAEAWEQIQNSNPPISLVVSDLNMPNSSGLDLLLRIRSSEQHKNLPFLMMSAVSEQKNIISSMKAGADYYLVKPFQMADLVSKLKIIFEKRNGVAS